MTFDDRVDAGRRLAAPVRALGEARPAVLGIARGGVVVGRALATELHLPCDVAVVRKVGAPWNRELALGAVAPGIAVLDPQALGANDVGEEDLRAELEEAVREMERREARYRGVCPGPDLAGRTVILVDDGIATGSTAIAAVRWARAAGAARVVLAAPVATADAVALLRREADAVVVLETPASFHAVGEWYRDFHQATDEDVLAALDREAA